MIDMLRQRYFRTYNEDGRMADSWVHVGTPGPLDPKIKRQCKKGHDACLARVSEKKSAINHKSLLTVLDRVGGEMKVQKIESVFRV